MTRILPNNTSIVTLREGLRPGIRPVLLLLLTFVTVSRHAHPENLPPPNQGASPTVFSTPLGSSEAQLKISGSWNTQIGGSLGYGLDTAGGGLFPTSFPGMTQGFNFQQTPNLDIALRLLDRFFFKTSFVDTSASPSSNLPLNLNTFVLGYDGKPNEFLQSVRIGNSEVNMGSYDFLSFPGASPSSLGASASFSTGSGTYQAMVRYEPAALHKRIFIGHNEISDQRLAPGSYVDGQFFVLPDANVQNVTVYIEDGTGTIQGSRGHLYRVADSSDVVINAKAGTIAFRKPLAGRALVSYTKNGATVGSPSLGQDFLPQVGPNGQLDLSKTPTQFTWSTQDPYTPGQTFAQTSEIAINGQNALLLYSPGQFSPFQADNVYSLGSNLPSADTSISAALVPNGTDSLSGFSAASGSQGAASFLNLTGGQGLRVSVDTTNENFTVLGFTQSGSQPTIDPRSIAARYPLTSLPQIYSAGLGRAPQDSSEQLLLRMSTPVPDFQLDTDIVKGSVRVTRNGRSDTGFSLDYSTGILSFNVPVADDDVIYVSYRTTNTTKPGGNLLFGLGADFALSPSLNLDLGAGLKWAVFSGSYSTEEGTNTGSALLTAGLHYNQNKSEGLRANLEAGLSLSSPDTTGTFLLFGMEGDGTSVPMTEGSLFPSSFPQASEFTSASITSPLSSFSNANRGELIYKDYHQYTAGGAVLQQITWPIPASQVYPYTAGSYTGPYPVYDPSQGTVMVMDYRMNASQDWVGAQIPLPGAPENLTGAQSITFEIKSTLPASQISAYLQIGAVSENLDGTNTLETSGSTAVKAFPFNDNGTVLTTTGGASPKTGGLYSSEDTNGNGILNLENSSLVVTKEISTPSNPGFSSSGWKQVTFNLTPAERAKLSYADAIRIVLVDTSGANLASTFEVSGFSIAEAPFRVATNPDTTTVKEVNDPQPAGKTLEDLFPKVKSTFYPSGQTQKVLDVSWQNAPSSSPAWQLAGYPNPVSAGIYQDLVFYLLVQSPASGGTLSLGLEDQNGRGIKLASLPLGADNTWHKYEVNLQTGAVTEDGKAIGVTASLDSGVSRYTQLQLSSSGAANGNIYLGEIYLSHAAVKLSAGATFDGSYSKKGVVASAFGLPIVRDLSVKEQASVAGPDFASGFAGFPSTSSVSSASDVGASLPFGRVGAHFAVTATPSQLTLSGGQSVDVPIGPVTVGDSYSQTVQGAQMTFSRADHIDLSAGRFVSASLRDSSTAFGPQLSQSLQTNANVTPGGPFSFSMTGQLDNQVDQFSPFSLEYFPNWARSFSLLAPVSESDAARTGSLQLDGRLRLSRPHSTTQVQLVLQPTGSYQNSLAGERTQTSAGGFTLSLPIVSSAPALEGLTVTPSYSRSFSSTAATPTDQGFPQDFAAYGNALAGAPYLYRSIPFAELFSPTTLSRFTSDTAGLQAAQYQPQVSLAVARQTGSAVRDLILPAQLVLSMGRTLDRQADSVTTTLNWQVQYGTDALNLFGSAGVHPFFHFYKTEEIANNLDLKGTQTGLTSAVLQDLVTLYFAAGNKLQLNHRLDLTWDTALQASDTATLSYTYRLRYHLALPVVPMQLQQGSYLQNTESLTVETAPDLTQNSLQVNLDHETAMILPDHGKITASAGLGLAENRISAGDSRILFGIQASVGAQLSF